MKRIDSPTGSTKGIGPTVFQTIRDSDNLAKSEGFITELLNSKTTVQCAMSVNGRLAFDCLLVYHIYDFISSIPGIVSGFA